MNTLLDQAIANDVREHVELAAGKYEQVLAQPDAPPEAYVNLICLYWQSTGFGFASFHKLSDDFYSQAWGKCFDLLKEAQRLFPQHGEVLFWGRYIGWAELNEAFPDEECLVLAQMPSAASVPYFRLYTPSKPEYEAQAWELLETCEAQPTAKNRHILSVLRSKLQQPRRHSEA